MIYPSSSESFYDTGDFTNNDNSPSVTVIIPVRITEARRDILTRLKSLRDYREVPSEIDFLVVDDGSSEADFLLLCNLERERMQVIRTGALNRQRFSLARARNYAVQRAKGDFVMFMDADLVSYNCFYDDILVEIKALQMRTNVNRFLMVPVIYLTDAGFTVMKQTPPSEWRSIFINAMNSANTALIEKYSSGTSVLVVERFYYLARGGQDEEFEGWGYEDYEFANRLIRRLQMFPLPENWLSMAGNFMSVNSYQGWKSCYRLHGDWLAAKGIYLFHAPHSIEEEYHENKDQNLQQLVAKMLEDQTAPDEPPALPALDCGVSVLFRSNPFCWNREFAPFLGVPVFVKETEFESASAFEAFLKDKSVTRVVFPNPYANDKLLTLYRWCKDNAFPVVVCERGALPDAVYHDASGFLSEGQSYAARLWDVPLDPTQRENALKYIAEVRYGSSMLEQQASRDDLSMVRDKLGIRHDQKVLLVPFQQPNDTVIRYFAGSIDSYDKFRKRISDIATRLGPDWVVVYKKHPAEIDFASIDRAVSAHGENIYDLLELATAVAVINSGVGIYAMMFGKPLLVFGDAWYSFEGLCQVVRPTDDPVALLNSEMPVDYERVLRFIHYLRFEFYSFGTMTTRRVTMPNGSPITATSSIAYYEIRGWAKSPRLIKLFDNTIPYTAPLFDRYRGSISSIREGRLLFHAKKYAKAASAFQRWIDMEPTNPVAFRSAAEAYYSAGDVQLARECLVKASALLPSNKNVAARLRYFNRTGIFSITFAGRRPFPIDLQ